MGGREGGREGEREGGREKEGGRQGERGREAGRVKIVESYCVYIDLHWNITNQPRPRNFHMTSCGESYKYLPVEGVVISTLEMGILTFQTCLSHLHNSASLTPSPQNNLLAKLAQFFR